MHPFHFCPGIFAIPKRDCMAPAVGYRNRPYQIQLNFPQELAEIGLNELGGGGGGVRLCVTGWLGAMVKVQGPRDKTG